LFLRRFPVRGHGRDRAAAPELKVFWFFSSEKNIFLPSDVFVMQRIDALRH
jgi:hypothetical protein